MCTCARDDDDDDDDVVCLSHRVVSKTKQTINPEVGESRTVMTDLCFN